MSAKSQTPAETLVALRAFYETHLTSLNTLLANPELAKPENEAYRLEVTKMRGHLTEQLAGMPVTVPADPADLSWVERLIASVYSMTKNTADAVKSVATDLNVKTLALCALEKKVKDGDLIDKATAKTAVDDARREERDALLPQIASMRKKTVELAGLTAAPEEILKLDEPAFQTALTAAKSNVTKLGEKGLKLGGKGAKLVERCTWKAESEFNNEVATYADLMSGTGNPPIDPLHGNQGKDKKTGEQIAC